MTEPNWAERYCLMVFMRRFEMACLAGVASKEIHGELHAAIGQESIAVALAEHLRADDALASTHRNHLHALAKGVDPRALLAEIYEKESGLCGGFGGHMHIFDEPRRFSTTGIVGASLPVALGHAYAAKLRGNDSVAVAAAGDGSVNTGAFHETMNMAGALSLPLVVLVENNEWAISVPFSASSATATIAERSVAYDAPGWRVDGMQIDVVSDALELAFAHARAGRGPAIVEAMCYRFRGHYEGDLDMYRDATEKQDWVDNRDPLTETRKRILAESWLTSDQITDIEAAVQSEMDDLLAAVRADASPDPSTASEHVFVSGLKLNGRTPR